MGDNLLQALYQQYLMTQDPQMAVEFMHHYMRQTEIPTKLTARTIPTPDWIALSEKQGCYLSQCLESNDFEKLIENYGLQCQCGDVFFNPAVLDIPFNYPRSSIIFGQFCQLCKVPACGRCNFLTRVNPWGFNYYCQSCLLIKIAQSLKEGNILYVNEFQPQMPSYSSGIPGITGIQGATGLQGLTGPG